MPESIPSNNNLREQFVSEQIPVGLPWHLLVFSIFLLAFSIFVYFGLRLGYESYLSATDASLDKKIDELAKQVSKGEQQNFISFYSQLINLKKVLNNHEFGSNIYGFLERNTLPPVYYYEADFLAEDGTFELKGRADSLETLVSQLTLFDKSEDLEKTVLEQMNFEGNEVGFDVILTFKPDFFEIPRQ